LLNNLENIVKEKENKTIVFTATKRTADEISYCLKKAGYAAMAIHGDKSQSERDYTLANFRNGRCSIMVATDVAARGLDVKDIKFVVNYDFPNSVEDYVHRIGRTGRANTYGTSITYFTAENFRSAKDLVTVLKEAKQEIDPKLIEMARPRGGHGGGGFSRYGHQAGGNRFGGNGGGRKW